ncbi:MAG: FG-GAP-like repeat-containing protein, partial [Thermodesulfovibrionia bacterium]|nr:FG-GAP-like repeat-containing protein [Thermodesulfovibrionia bacterium]
KYDAHSFATNSANKIAYQYYNPKYMGDADYGNIRLLAIGYAASEPGSYAKVNFVYDNPGVRPDISKSFSYPGLPTLTDTRLKSISASYVSAGSPGGIIRTFNIAYRDEVSAIGRNNSSKVHSVTECAGAVCLRPTVFTWSDQATDFSFSTTSTNVVGFENYIEPPPSTTRPEITTSSSITANVDGDSNRDLIWIEGASGDFSFRVAMSTGSTLATTSYESSSFNEIYGWTVTDYNHDNYADFLVVSSANGTETLSLFLNKDIGGGVRGYEVTPAVLIADLGYTSSSKKAQFSDFNSDGEVDLLYDFKLRYLEPDPQQLNGPFRFSTESVYITESTINSLISSAYNSAGSLVSSAFQIGQLAEQNVDEMKFGTDFTRDGIPDIHMPVYHRQCNYVTEDPPEYSCQLSPLVAAEFIFKGNPAGGFTFWGLARLNYGANTRCWPADLNSDGLPDLVCDGGRISFNRGTYMGDTAIASSIANQMLHSLIDYNQDGYLDFVYKGVNTPKLKVLLWSNGTFEEDPSKAIDIAYTNYYEPFGPAGSFLDINGDGLDDYVNFNTGVFLGRTAATATNSTKAYNLITKIRDGLGNEKHIDYKPMTDASVYVRESDAMSKNWGAVVVDYVAPRYVVSQVRNKTPAFDETTGSFNIEANSAMSYTYAGMKVQPAGRGMLGFHKMSVLDEQTGMRTETTYLQQFPFTGLPAESKTYVANNATPLSETS